MINSIAVVFNKSSACLITAWFLLCLCSTSHAQKQDPASALAPVAVSDSATGKSGKKPTPDTTLITAHGKTDSLSSALLKTATTDQKPQQKLKLIKRKYSAGQQVLLATGMMIFVIGIMTMAQQWNPR